LLHFEVRDTGIGMSQAEQETSSTPFPGRQLHHPPLRRHRPGLSICKHIVELMHGDITVSSTPGTGSCFSFTCRLGKAQSQPTQPSTLPDIRGMRALVVDDNAAAREVFVHMLQACNWKPTRWTAARQPCGPAAGA
jgi:hypothetical protein